MPNNPSRPNGAKPANRPAPAAIERTLDAFEELQTRLMAVHAPEFTAVDLTMAQAKLVYVVAASGELSMSEIARRLGVTASTASGAVDHLVSTGFLTRSDDPANRRQVRVSATAYAMETLEQLRELGTRQMRSLLSVVSARDLAVIERAARILMDAIPHATATTDAPAPTDPATHDKTPARSNP